jgi:chromosome segregation ATPase
LVAKHEELLANLRRQKPRLEQAVTEATEAVTKAEEIEKRATDARASAGKAESDKAAIIDNLKAQSTNRLNAFGHNISSVMREIDKAKWVMGKPIGPLGMHVKLEDPRYTQAFHSILASTLCQFAVRCDQDRRTMTAILRKCAQQA